MDTGYRFSEIFSLIRESLQGSTVLHESAVLLSGILALIAILGWYSRTSAGDRGEGHLPVLRTAAIAFAVWNFSTFVLGPADALSKAISSEIQQSIEEKTPDVDESIKEAYLRSEEAYSEESLLGQYDEISGEYDTEDESLVEADGPSFWNKVKDNILGILSKIGTKGLIGFNLSSNALSVITGMIADLSRSVLTIVSGMYLLILGEAGPLVFALSILPSFRRSFLSWFSKYIQVSFWVPVCSFIEYMGNLAKEAVVDIFSRGDFYEKMIFPSFQFTVIDLSVIILVLATPKICSWLVDSAGPGVFSAVAAEGKRIAHRTL